MACCLCRVWFWLRVCAVCVRVRGHTDPFLWQSPRGFHLLMHDHEPFPFHKQVLTYAFTSDRSAMHGTRIERLFCDATFSYGRETMMHLPRQARDEQKERTEQTVSSAGWRFSYVEAANGTDIAFDDGSHHTFCSRQRPQLFFSEVARSVFFFCFDPCR